MNEVKSEHIVSFHYSYTMTTTNLAETHLSKNIVKNEEKVCKRHLIGL